MLDRRGWLVSYSLRILVWRDSLRGPRSAACSAEGGNWEGEWERPSRGEGRGGVSWAFPSPEVGAAAKVRKSGSQVGKCGRFRGRISGSPLVRPGATQPNL